MTKMRDEEDDFWDIASLLPAHKSTSSAKGAGEIVLSSVTDGPQKTETHARAQENLYSTPVGEATHEYVPLYNPFICRLRVFEKKSHVHLFHGFKTQGAQWHSLRGTPTAYAPYFSFVPQYDQLNSAQKAFYLYFREEANAGNYLDAGQSYVLLYIFEILNLPDLIPPKIGILRLANLWAAYRKKIPMLDKNLIPWLADYGLLHGVPCPRNVLAPFLEEILAKSRFKEFYLGVEEEWEGGGATEALILLTSQYKYQNSRYVQGEHKELFSTHIQKAAAAVLHRVFLEGGKLSYHTVTKRMDTFVGALWAGPSRYEIELTYYSLTETDELKILMTAAVKHAENKVRAYLSIKSRLTVSCLPEEYKNLIDGYFAKALPPVSGAEKGATPRPDYEALYDPLTVGVSTVEAAHIESASWENTWRLIPEDEKEEIFGASPSVTNEADPAALPKSDTPQSVGLSEAECSFLKALLSGGSRAARVYAKECGHSYLSLGERINEYFSELIGDIVLNLDGEDFSVIEDYESEIQEVITSSK